VRAGEPPPHGPGRREVVAEVKEEDGGDERCRHDGEGFLPDQGTVPSPGGQDPDPPMTQAS